MYHFSIFLCNDQLSIDDFCLQEKIRNECLSRDGYLTVDQVCACINSLRGQSIFSGVQTTDQLKAYVQEKSCSSGDVALEQVVMKYKMVWKQGIPTRVPEDFGYTVSFKPQLQQLLECKDVMDCVQNPKHSSGSIFADVTDGLFYKHHPVVTQNKDAPVLTIALYYDDVELCDPLKTKVMLHNMRLFYWVLLNIYPELRSKLKAINLLGMVKKRIAKVYGNTAMLKDFVSELKNAGDRPIYLTINGVLTKFYLILLFVSGDLPALNELAGIKESHFALRSCRFCMVLKQDMWMLTREDSRLLRNKADHAIYVREVMRQAGDTGGQPTDCDSDEESEISALEKFTDHIEASKNFGINKESALASVPYFDVTKCFLADTMHTLAEGVARDVCRVLLRDACVRNKNAILPEEKKQRLSLKKVNETLSLCHYGVWHKNKPSLIEPDHLHKKLRQSAAQMVVLVHLLPFLIISYVSEKKMKLLLMLLDLMALTNLFSYTEADIQRLDNCIHEFLTLLYAVYPELKMLKLHSLLHLPMQIRLFGPLRQHACYRFEAMHSQFTSLVPVIRSMKNITFSLSARYILRRNTEIMLAKESGKFFDDSFLMSKAEVVSIESRPEKDCLSQWYPFDSEIKKLKKVTKFGNIWTEGVIMCVSKDVFGRIHSVYLLDDELVFTYHPLATTFVKTYNAFEILQCQTEYECIRLRDLHSSVPVVRFSIHLPNSVLKSYLLETSCVSID